MKTVKGRWAGKTIQQQTLPRSTERIDTNGETVKSRLVGMTYGKDNLPIMVDYGSIEVKLLAIAAKAKKKGMTR